MITTTDTSTNREMRTSRTVRQKAAALAVVLAVLTGAMAGIGPVGASSDTDDPAEAGDWGAGWLAAQVEPDGSVEGGFDTLGDAALVAVEDARVDRGHALIEGREHGVHGAEADRVDLVRADARCLAGFRQCGANAVEP